MAGMFVRRYKVDPGADTLLEIESVNILDLEPEADITGVGTGTALMVGEFENGPFGVPTEVSSQDLVSTFGTLGYKYGSVSANYPCAVSRSADGAVTPEYWNGNGFIQLANKKFRRLILCRADTSVGEVTFTALGFLTGTAAAVSYALTTGQILSLDVGAGQVHSTFTGAKAVVTGVSGTYPTTFGGGETLVLGYDGAANFTTTFLSGDQAVADVVARINQYAGITFATVSSGQVRLTGVQGGTGGQVRVVSGSSGVLTKLGLTAANTAGTGNVVDISAVTPEEIHTIVHAAAGVTVEQDANSYLRLSFDGDMVVGSDTTATNLGFVVGAESSTPVGILPAGTVVENSGETRVFVTMRDLSWTGDDDDQTVEVRHAVDDGTGLSASTGTLTRIPSPPTIGAFSVENLQLVSAALTESQIDAAYSDALDATLDLNSVAAETNLIWAARQSNVIRRALKANELAASAGGMAGRAALIRPPLNTLKAAAKSDSVEPGVGMYREEGVIYCYPGWSTFVSLIARRGVAGGAGFTADGVVDVGADGFLASILSQIAPEEDPGQDTGLLTGVVGIESGANTTGFDINDYIAFKASGICAPRMDFGTPVYQSGVTSVDPLEDEPLTTIARRRMSYYLEDTAAARAKQFGKKTNTVLRRKAIAGEIRAWLKGLKSEDQPAAQRIADYSVDEVSGNTKALLARGLYRIIVRVQTLSSLKAIVLAFTVGESVSVE